MEDKILNTELLINKLLEEEEEFHHVNNPAADIKPVIKKYLGVPNHAEQLKSTLLMAMPKLR